MATRNVTRKLKENVVKEPYKIITAEVRASFVKDSNKTLTVGLVAEVNDSSIEDVTEQLFNQCLIEVNHLLEKANA